MTKIGENTSKRKISEISGVNHTRVKNCLKQLVEEGIVKEDTSDTWSKWGLVQAQNAARMEELSIEAMLS